ncbi:MAG: hypothetical protein HN742_15100 [Lentisphaerae bacterium]|jgi:hypothetical protein|nr:hypothetical protein [Lentisphaerota bacterium]MBT4814649.1 hypothetical protein [Lentisphaerota bacterium]MBT5609590.1 hypothetical protein [Lentisphaerota bacterium]MBT7057786.1 hypothetical protein [Lentisphaerota bacterium]MBT7843205.1 hypothetical protein [Lentisphaerota bacterium]
MNCPLTDDSLLNYVDGDLPPAQTTAVQEHLAGCPTCRRRLGALEQADALLREAAREDVSAGLLHSARRALSDETGVGHVSEILTLEEAASFLRIEPGDMDEIAAELPVFELAGRYRVRRSKLLEWVAQRERAQTQARLSGELSRQIASGGA